MKLIDLAKRHLTTGSAIPVKPARSVKTVVAATYAALSLFIVDARAACPTTGLPIIVGATGTVTAKFEFVGPTVAFSDDLYLESPANNLGVIFNNKRDPVGTTKVLGTFPAGTELVFRLRVNDTGRDYFTGSGNRNPDGLPHAVVSSSATGVKVSFEDLYGLPECPSDSFKDLVFSFTGVASQFVATDPYINFRVVPSAGTTPVSRQINVRDRFLADGATYDMSGPIGLAMAARTAKVTAKSKSVALNSFGLFNGPPSPPAELDVVTDLGRLRVKLGSASRLAFPSSFARSGAPAPVNPDLNKGIQDPLKCYSVSYRRRAFARLSKYMVLRSKFSGVLKGYNATKVTALCTPAAVDSESFTPIRGDTHMMCFNAVPETGRKAKRVNNVFLNNTIGQIAVDAVRDREYCLPATIAVQ